MITNRNIMKLKNKIIIFYCLLLTAYCLLLTGCAKKESLPPIVTPQKEWGMVRIEKTYGIADGVDKYPDGGELTPTGWAGDCNPDPGYLTSNFYPYYAVRDYTTSDILIIGIDQPDSCKFATIGVFASDLNGDPAELTCSASANAGRLSRRYPLYPISGAQPGMGCRYNWYPPADAAGKPIKGDFTIKVTVGDEEGNTASCTFRVRVQENYQ